MELFLQDFPNPYEEGNFDNVIADVAEAGERYKVGGFWYFFHERLWEIRGMENLFMDYYDHLEELKIVQADYRRSSRCR